MRIQVLPAGEVAKPNGSNNPCLNSKAVLVYGVVSGNPGWTEVYGWIHEGKWQDDFAKLVAEKQNELSEKERQEKETQKIAKKKQDDKELSLLADYTSSDSDLTASKA